MRGAYGVTLSNGISTSASLARCVELTRAQSANEQNRAAAAVPPPIDTKSETLKQDVASACFVRGISHRQNSRMQRGNAPFGGERSTAMMRRQGGCLGLDPGR